MRAYRCVEQSFEEVKAGVRVMAIFFKANLKERKVNIQVRRGAAVVRLAGGWVGGA